MSKLLKVQAQVRNVTSLQDQYRRQKTVRLDVTLPTDWSYNLCFPDYGIYGSPHEPEAMIHHLVSQFADDLRRKVVRALEEESVRKQTAHIKPNLNILL